MKENNKQNRLGRGLASIFNKKQEPSNKNTSLVDIKLIEKNPFQPRLKIADKELKELTKSIKTYGLIQPITVRKKHKILMASCFFRPLKKVSVKKHTSPWVKLDALMLSVLLEPSGTVWLSFKPDWLVKLLENYVTEV